MQPSSDTGTRGHGEAAIRAHSPAPITALAAAVVLLLNGCSDSQNDVMATATCPEPLRRILVATQTSAPGSNDVVGAATPSPTIDPTEQHPITAAATFRPDDGSRAEPVTVTIDDGTGGGTTVGETCQVLTFHLALDAGERSTPYGQVQPGRLHLVNDQGAGSVRLIDQPSYIREADDGSGAQDYGLITGWYALVENPVAGRYRTQQTIRWEQVPRPAATDTAVDDAAGESARRYLIGTVDLEITVG